MQDQKKKKEKMFIDCGQLCTILNTPAYTWHMYRNNVAALQPRCRGITSAQRVDEDSQSFSKNFQN